MLRWLIWFWYLLKLWTCGPKDLCVYVCARVCVSGGGQRVWVYVVWGQAGFLSVRVCVPELLELSVCSTIGRRLKTPGSFHWQPACTLGHTTPQMQHVCRYSMLSEAHWVDPPHPVCFPEEPVPSGRVWVGRRR